MKKRPISGRSFFLEGGETGVLLLHGFTGTPQCMRFLGDALNKAKFTVSCPLIEGHGTHLKHLEQTQWEDWYESGKEAFQKLKGQCRQVMVAGLSMGGLVAAHLAYHYPRSVKALGLMATPLFLDGFLIRSLFPAIWKTPLKKIYKYQPKAVASIRDPNARRRYQTYDRIPVAGVATLLDFQKEVRQELKHIRQPTIILHSLHDQKVPYGNLDYIKAIIASREIKTVTLKRSNHIITVDYDKEIVARRIIRFFKKHRRG